MRRSGKDNDGTRTSRTRLSLPVRIMNSDVHARSLGLWPTPAARTVFSSRRASSSTSAHSYSFRGSNTHSGAHVNVWPQFVNVPCCEPARMVIGARRL